MNTKQIRLKERPVGMPTYETFDWTNNEVSEPSEGEVLLKSIYISVDPYMRGRMNDQKSYVEPYRVGEVISGGVIAEVVKSNSAEYVPGDLVIGNLGWQTYQIANEDHLRKIDPKQAPISTHLGVIGMPGMTAYFGLLDIGKPESGETVVVSGAAGAVGTVVGQIAKIAGARVVGIAGTDEKIKYLKEELHFDEVINYKSDQYFEALREACPKGVDVYYDNVGGEVSDAVLRLINKGARIPICGQISLYNLEKPDYGMRVQPNLLVNSALMKGFIVSDYGAHFEEAIKDLSNWLQEGKLKYKETIVEGFENIPEAFIGLFKGENIGKYIVKVADPEHN
ncbi:NADP-dependent oxidoreductase [Pseudalkalibacillus berkeleyi]|uniref:NADP-dependent oxidoreductase n=1 Tax=Pseudalkalibacillus berkeleyi TaxID=1069813 RepID=A0ABS9H0B4_9BACL|nr:NADP-dependent oxidoreductase [Pseudalkalibacillus berkeleyi]MCF6137361.1 NADP-dependent oxidoreductase [Pseudalkalibacillus berkeleyi]